jgi:hypothetical protein
MRFSGIVRFRQKHQLSPPRGQPVVNRTDDDVAGWWKNGDSDSLITSQIN